MVAGHPGKTPEGSQGQISLTQLISPHLPRMDHADLVSSILLPQPVTGLLHLFSACSLLFCPHERIADHHFIVNNHTKADAPMVGAELCQDPAVLLQLRPASPEFLPYYELGTYKSLLSSFFSRNKNKFPPIEGGMSWAPFWK